VNIYQVDELYGNAYVRASTAENSASGFRKAGPCAYNTSIFKSHEFLVAERLRAKLLLKPPKNLNQASPVIKLILT
jgi:hypothetical protein